MAAVLLSILAGAAIAFWPQAVWPLVCAPIVLLLRMALNAIDGLLAREHGMKSRLGAVLNELGDVVSDAALYLPFALIPDVSAQLIVLIVILAILSEMTGVVAAVVSGDRRYDGPMGKSDRALVFALLAIALALGLNNETVIDLILAVVAGLLVLTVINRARAATREPS